MDRDATVVPFRAPTPLGDRLERRGHLTIDSTLGQLMVYQRLNREWRRHLSDTDFTLLSILVDQSVGFQRATYNTTVPRIIQGTKVTGPWQVAPNTVRRSLARLEELGFISRVQGVVETTFTINLEWTPMILTAPKCRKSRIDGTVDDLKKWEDTPKEAEGVPTSGQGGYPCEGRGGTHQWVGGVPTREHPLEGKEGIEEPEEEGIEPRPVAAPRQRVRTLDGKIKIVQAGFQENSLSSDTLAPQQFRELIDQTAKRSTEARKAKLEKARKSSGPYAVEATWKAVWRESYAPTHPPMPWGKREVAQMTLVARQWQDMKLGNVHDFVAWTVKHWPEVMRKSFAWMKRERPSHPEPGFLLRWLRNFANEWCKRQSYEWVQTLPDREKREVERLRLEGFSYEDAILEVAKGRAVAADREKRAADLAEMHRMARIIATQKAEVQKQILRSQAPRPPNAGGGTGGPDFSLRGVHSDDLKDW